MQKAARTEPLNQIKDEAEFGLQPTELAHRAQNEDVGHPGIDLGAQMADLSSGRGGGESLAENLTQRPEIDRRMGHLAVVGDLELPKTMQVGKIHAAFQVSVGGDHATAGVICIAESAQGLGLQLGQVRLKSEVETLLMFSEAAFDVAAREMQIAAQEMDAGAHLDEPVPSAAAWARSRSANAPSRSSVTRLTAARPSQAAARARSSAAASSARLVGDAAIRP